MHFNFDRKRFTVLATSICLTSLLQGCLSEDEPSEASNERVSAIRLSGSVGDGPIVNAAISVFSQSGALLAETQSDASATYEVLVEVESADYPLIVASSGGLDLVTDRGPDFDLFGASVTPGSSGVANINPYTTFVVEVARDLGNGLSDEDLSLAESNVKSTLDFGLMTFRARSTLSTEIDSSNIAEIVRAAEGLGEAIRRVRNLLNQTGRPATGDIVLRAIASDVTDGLLDGRGGAETDARTSAIMKIVATQVLFESMQDELFVYGADATQSMVDAIATANGGTPSPTLAELAVTDRMLEIAELGLIAVRAIDNSPGLQGLIDALGSVEVGMQALSVRTIVPVSYSSTLMTLTEAVANATDAEIDAILRQGPGTPINREPVISGTPANSVLSGSVYSFQASATDADGDALVFSIQNLPSWADFDEVSGLLSGTPMATDIGSYQGIVISVSDGQASASLPAFTITVSDLPPGNTAPTISGTPPSSVMAGSNYLFQAIASDADGDSLTFSISNIPGWADFNPDNGILSGTPTEANVGSYSNIVISVTDGIDSAQLPAFTVTVQSPVVQNTPPTISGTPASSVVAGSAYAFQPDAGDADGDTLTFSVLNLPTWAEFDSGAGSLSGTPVEQDVGTYSEITISVTDGIDSAELPAFSITVETDEATNVAPVISGNPADSVTVDSTYSFQPTASDSDGDTLIFSVTGLPSWATFNTSSGTISGTPTDADVGEYSNIVISVSDGQETASLAPFSITVNAISLGSVTLGWTAPTLNEDGSALVDLAGYKLYWGTSPGTYPNSITIDTPGQTTVVVDNLAPGDYYFVATAYDLDDTESEYSAFAVVTIE